MTNDNTLTGSALLLDCRLNPQNYHELAKLTRDEAQALISALVMKAMLYRGQRQDTDTVVFVSNALLDELQQNDAGVWAITVEEVQYIFRAAVLHNADFYVCVASLYRVILEFWKGPGRDIRKEAEFKRKKKQEAAAVGTFIQASAVDLNDKFKTN